MFSKNQIKEIQALHNKKFRDRQKRFITEGIKSVLEIVAGRPNVIEHILATEDFILEHAPQLKKAGVNFFTVTPVTLQKLSLQNSPNKVMAVCHYFNNDKNQAFDFEKGFTFYLDDISDPGNFGTIIRLANWFGLEAVYCSQNSCDLYNPKVIQASMGAFLRVKIIYTELEQLLAQEKINVVYGAVLNGKNIYNEQLANGLIVIGNEARGIQAGNLKLVNRPLMIPAHAGSDAESLNAAMAASIIASEFFRRLKN